MLILESEAHARRRGAPILGFLSGYGSSASAGKITETTWEGIAETMRRALIEADVPLDAVDYINAHGTSTPMNDPAETTAIKNLFGTLASSIPISSTKSMIGHLIAASGAVEAVVCIQSIRRGRIHPTRNLDKPDPACDLDYVPEAARERAVHTALSNSLGFAGINSSLVFCAPEAAEQ